MNQQDSVSEPKKTPFQQAAETKARELGMPVDGDDRNQEIRIVERICHSIVDEGRSPEYHRNQLNELSIRMPVLAQALYDLLQARGFNAPPILYTGAQYR